MLMDQLLLTASHLSLGLCPFMYSSLICSIFIQAGAEVPGEAGAEESSAAGSRIDEGQGRQKNEGQTGWYRRALRVRFFFNVVVGPRSS